MDFETMARKFENYRRKGLYANSDEYLFAKKLVAHNAPLASDEAVDRFVNLAAGFYVGYMKGKQDAN